MGTIQPWEGPRAPSSREKTTASAPDAKSRAELLLPPSLSPAAQVSPCLWHLVALECHQAEATASTELQLCGGRGEGVLGWLFHTAPHPSEHFSSISEQVTAWCHWGHPKCPVPIPTRAPSPVPPRAELLFPPDPPQVLKIAAGALTHNSHPPSQPAAAPGAVSPSVPPLHGHTGLAAAPCTHCPARRQFSLHNAGINVQASSCSRVSHPARMALGGFTLCFPSLRNPNPPAGLSAHHHHPLHHLTRTPKAARTLPPWRAGLGCPRARWRGLPGRVPAVSPRQPPGQRRLPWQDSRLGKAAADGGEVLGKQQGGRRRRRLPQTPSGLALHPWRVSGGSPEGSRCAPGAFPVRSRRAGTEALAPAGLPTQEICPSCLQLAASRAFRAVMQNPPRPPCRDIHTPPAPYAACALTQEVRTGSCHLLCHRAGHKKPGRGRGRHPERKNESGKQSG